MNPRGKTALVIGAASGIGAATARELAKAGARSVRAALVVVLGFQISCGDSSGPSTRVASSVSANSSTTQSGSVGVAVADLPSVVVRDQNATPLGDVTATFTVISGGGSVTGANAVTNSSGIATVGSWTLGNAPGINTLEARVAALPPVTFTADVADFCLARETHVFGSTNSGILTTADCRVSQGFYVDWFNTAVTVSDGLPLLFTMSATGFNALIIIRFPDGRVIGTMGESQTTSTSALKVFLPVGNYLLSLSGDQPNVTGSYTLTSSANGPGVTNCERVFAAPGAPISQAIEGNDCPFSGGFYDDDYYVYLLAGQQIRISMHSTVIDPWLIIYDTQGDALLSNDNKDSSTKDAEVTFTVPTTGFYLIAARNNVVGETGSYTLAIQ